jgi:Fe-Mn family superoxide dismutase
MGSGWGALVWEPLSARLLTVQLHDHQSHSTQGAVPRLVIDAWEHAWYLQYLNEKAKFFDAIWHLFNWDDVAARLGSVRDLDLGLHGVAAGGNGGTARGSGKSRQVPQPPAGRA